MATKYWYGAATTTGKAGDWSWDDSSNSYADSNWQDSTGTGVAAPVSDDIVIFSQGDENVIAGLDQSTVTLAAMTILPGYTGLIGLSTSRLDIGSLLCNFNNPSTLYIKLRGNSICTFNSGISATTNVLLKSIPTAINIFRGNIYLSCVSAASITDILVDAITGQSTDARVNFSVFSSVSYTLVSGTIDSTCNNSTAILYGGTVNQTAGTPGTVMLYKGTYNYSGTGTTVALYAYGGLYNAAQCTKLTLSNVSVIYSTASVMLVNGRRNITGTFTSYGAMPAVDFGTSVTIT